LIRALTRRLFFAALTVGMVVTSAGQVSAFPFTNLLNLAITNGTAPYAGLILAGSVLYGTAENYGGGPGGGSGTVFRINPDGTGFTNLHAFSGSSDGGQVYAGLVLAGNILYGAAYSGGKFNSGTIFALNTNGTGFTNLYHFSAGATSLPYTNSDGAYPSAALILSGNTLFGTTTTGGTYGQGTVFRLNTNGTAFTNLYSFSALNPSTSTNTDGAVPYSGLVISGSTLFGAAYEGGFSGCGSIFSLNTDGSGFTYLFNFNGGDGTGPYASLILSGNTLFGAALYGGSGEAGTLFRLNTNGSSFTNLHVFSSTSGANSTNTDGATPYAALTLADNTLYGPTGAGGASGNGTLFQVNTDGTGFTTLYNFTALNTNTSTNTDGAVPRGSILLSGDILFGTANTGGNSDGGTLFGFYLPPPLTITRSAAGVVLSWPANSAGFVLQSAPTATGIYSNIPGASSPYTNPITASPQFFRLTHP